MTSKKHPYPILVVDDEQAILEVMSVNLERRKYSVHTALTGREALIKSRENAYSVVILDYNLPDMNGLEILSELRNRDSDVTIIMITAYGTIEMAVAAMKSGAFNYLVKPINYDEMGLVVDMAVEHHRLRTELYDLKKQLDETFGKSGIVGSSNNIRRVYEKALTVAESDATVLIRGETGTGKELIARVIHRHSLRREQSFIRINCAAIPETLLESELFGHEKGAFTGAIRRKPGKFELAHNGTIYLDEIGDIPPSMQVKLLRVLQEGEMDRVGGSETITVDARVIATTNRDLEADIRENRFRMDLFYRLNVIPINVPPLRERKEDIPLLVNHFVKKYSDKNNKKIQDVPASFVSALMQYQWPGNVRELENVIERAVVLSAGEKLEEREIPVSGANGRFLNLNLAGDDISFLDSKKKVVESFEMRYLVRVMEKHGGNISAAAKDAQLDYKNFHSKLKKYRISKRQFGQV